MITRRAVVAGLSASGAFPYLAQAAWPDRPITMLHGFAPGGGADANARIAADGLSKVLGQTVLVESKSGAGTTLASAQLVRATPDGYTIALIATSYCATAALYKKFPYRPVEDINAIGLMSEAPMSSRRTPSIPLVPYRRCLTWRARRTAVSHMELPVSAPVTI